MAGMKLWGKYGGYGDRWVLSLHYEAEEGKYYLLSLRYVRGQLVLEESQVFMAPDEVMAYVKGFPGMPVVFSLGARSVMSGLIRERHPDPVAAVLGVSVSDPQAFWMQALPVERELQWVSLMRKDQLDEVLAPLEGIRGRILYVSISPMTLGFLIPAIQEYRPSYLYQMNLGTHVVSWKGGLQGNIEGNVWEVDEDQLSYGLQIPKPYLRAYASALHYYISLGADLRGLPEVAQYGEKIRTQGQWIRRLAPVLLGLLLVYLGGLGFQRYSEHAWQGAMMTISQGRATLDSLDARTERISLQQGFVKQHHQQQLRSSRASYWADRIAAAAPQKLYLEKMTLHPESKPLKKIDTDLAQRPPDILVEGWARQSEPVSMFSSRLADIEGVGETELFRSAYDFNTDQHRFILLLYLEDE